MNRRAFVNMNAGAAGSALMGKKVFAESRQKDTVPETAKQIEVVDTADIIILGAGPSGTAAAVAAGRFGLNVLLVERYGCLGGMATGGLIIMIGEYNSRMKGLPAEFVQRILESGGRLVETNRIIKDEPFFNPDVFQYVLLEMTEAARVRLRLHSWAVGVHVVNNEIDTIIVESKSGRQALRGKVIVDCTGDADTAEFAGVPFENTLSQIGLGLDFMYGEVDFTKYRQFMTYRKSEWEKVMAQTKSANISWRPWFIGWNDKAWFNTSYTGDPVNVDDLTNCEIELRKRIMKHYHFYKANVPGFEAATIERIASQIGCRSSRRIQGEHVITMADLKAGTFDDRIGRVSGLEREFLSDIPYRSLLPKKIDNVLYAGRCISADLDVINRIRGISGCWVTGQAAGVAAALSAKRNTSPRNLAIKDVQDALKKQGVDI